MSNCDSMLMRLCAENVYNDNIFHLLGLRTTVTPRQIRRKREDFESAKTLGSDSWREAFKHLMGNRPVPTSEEIDEAFTHLEDPAYRIVSEFFWMWPLDEDDRALDELAEGHRSEAFRTWEQAALSFGKRRIIGQHNLAVAYHFYALDAELQMLDNEGYAPPDFREKMLSYWEKSFSYWEELADNDDFWEMYESRVREFDDPRLTSAFVRYFRSEFPVAFDNINARLAARYAKASRFGDAKRHVEYMARTMNGLDDVQENMNIIFNPMEHRVSLLIDGYDAKVKADPKLGLECANKLLEDTTEIRRIAEAMLKDGQRIRTGLFTQIVTACNHYQVEYGNKTEDWGGCQKLLERLREIACTPESQKVVDGNIATVKGNIKYDREQHTCWFCKCVQADTNVEIAMHGEVNHDFLSKRITWRHLTINVPACASCKGHATSKESIKRMTRAVTIAICAIAGAIWMVAVGAGAAFIGGIFLGCWAGAFIANVTVAIADNCAGIEERCRDYEPIKQLLAKGWKFGKSPPSN